jgi:methyl-accepting chemotaxis protein
MSLENRMTVVEEAVITLKRLVISHDERLEDYYNAMEESRRDFDFKLNALINAQIKNEAEIREVKVSIVEVKDSIIEVKDSIVEIKDSIIELRKSTTELRESTTELRESTTELRESTNDLKETSKNTLERLDRLERKNGNK